MAQRRKTINDFYLLKKLRDLHIPTPPPSPLPDPYPRLREAEPPEIAEQLLTNRENVREMLGEPQLSDRREGELMFELPPPTDPIPFSEFYEDLPAASNFFGEGLTVGDHLKKHNQLMERMRGNLSELESEDSIRELLPTPNIFDPSRGWNRIKI